MPPRSLQAFLRSLADPATPAADEDLLRRVRSADEAAFAELVRRHGRLVWSACRGLTRCEAEADDAFQATFLVLLKNAGAVRDAGRLSTWLYGVAYRVCARGRQGAERRTARERAAAHPEAAGSAVPTSKWDRTLAAVHEEVAKLPDALRVPFVLCCLEGKGQTETAGLLGWPLSTLSHRLARAKDAVLARLDARGLTAGAVAGIGLAVPPPAAVARASALAHAGAIPGPVLHLSQGVIGMSVSSVKVVAATVLVAAGLGASALSGWVAAAGAQPPGLPGKQRADAAGAQPPGPAGKQRADLEEEVKRLQADLTRAKLLADELAVREAQARADAAAERQAVDQASEKYKRRKEAAAGLRTARWEYHLADQEAAYERGAFERLLQQKENDGWEFLGASTGGPSGGKIQWLFRRAAKPAFTEMPSNLSNPGGVDPRTHRNPFAPASDGRIPLPTADPAAVQAGIDRPTAAFRFRAKEDGVTIPKEAVPFAPKALAEVLAPAAEKKFGKGKVAVVATDAGVRVVGEPAVIEWVKEVVKALAGANSKPGS